MTQAKIQKHWRNGLCPNGKVFCHKHDSKGDREESIKSILLPRLQNEEWVEFFLMLLLTSAVSQNASDLSQIT